MIESCITFLPVEDLERTTDFYTRIIGLELWKDLGTCRIFSCGQGYFGFCHYGDGRAIPQGVCLSLNVADEAEVDRQAARIRALGVPVRGPQKQPGFPVYSCFVTDPDGYLVEFQKILA